MERCLNDPAIEEGVEIRGLFVFCTRKGLMMDRDFVEVLWQNRNIGYDVFEDDEDFEPPDKECIEAFKSAEMLGNTFPQRSMPLVQHGADHETLKAWQRPPSGAVREYQKSLAESSFFKNSLVVLPTGLGKTMIAILAMYNYRRWFPDSRIVFVTPTRPLVDQQSEAYIEKTGSSKKGIVSVTGTTPPPARTRLWRDNQIFFLTPLVIYNDIISGICDARSISLVIFDEAHHATKDHYYCKIVRKMVEMGCVFRIIGLTATPGSSTEAVQDVVRNLLIESIYMRSEKCSDVVPYIYRRKIVKVFCDLPEIIINYSKKLDDLMEMYLDRLRIYSYFKNKSLPSINRYSLIEMMTKPGIRTGTGPKDERRKGGSFYNRRKESNDSKSILTKFPSAFPNVYSLSVLLNAKQLLESYGLSQCIDVLKRFKDTQLSNMSTDLRRIRSVSDDFRVAKLVGLMQNDLERPQLCYHPKTDKVCEVLTKFFTEKKEGLNSDRRALVFSQFRASVDEICSALQKHSPLIMPSVFIGKSGSYRQKDQLKTLEEFKDGVFNVLVCTSVAEEGLDIGQVDMVIFYDLQRSTVRLIQRMGRTSRRREGTVVFLLSGKKSIFAFNHCMSKSKSLESHIMEEQGKNLIMAVHESCLRLPLADESLKCEYITFEGDTVNPGQSPPSASLSPRTESSYDSDEGGTSELPDYSASSKTSLPAHSPQKEPLSATIHPKLASFLYVQKRPLSSLRDANKPVNTPYFTGYRRSGVVSLPHNDAHISISCSILESVIFNQRTYGVSGRAPGSAAFLSPGLSANSIPRSRGIAHASKVIKKLWMR